MINCLIVDNERSAIESLNSYIEQTSFLHLINAVSSPIEALEIINSNPVDLVFLDIQLQGMTGLELIRTINGKCRVILYTAQREFALQGYELNVIDFLLKPVGLPRFLAAVQKVIDQIKNPIVPEVVLDVEPDFIFVKRGIKGKVMKIELSDIVYVESVKNYSIIYHSGKKTVVYASLKDLEKWLPKRRFVRVHKSFIIASSRITELDGNKIILQDAAMDIILGATYKSEVLDFIKRRTIG